MDTGETALLGGAVRLVQPTTGYRAATDPVLLAAATPARPGQTGLDLGAGVGAAAFCLAARVPGLTLHGLEIQPEIAALSERNAHLNGVAWTAHRGDLLDPPAAFRALSVDFVLANPPFHAEDDFAGPLPPKDSAHRLQGADLTDWVDAALRRLKPGGWLTMINRAAHLPLMLTALAGRAGDMRVLPLAARQGRAAKRVILAARKGARSPMRLLPPLILHAGDRHERDAPDFTEQTRAVLFDSAPLSLEADV